MEQIYAVPLQSLAPTSKIVNIGTLVNIIVKNAFTFAGIIALILLIFGGFRFIVAAGSGDAKQMEQGKKAITTAIIGLIVIATSLLLVQMIGILTGVPNILG